MEIAPSSEGTCPAAVCGEKGDLKRHTCGTLVATLVQISRSHRDPWRTYKTGHTTFFHQ